MGKQWAPTGPKLPREKPARYPFSNSVSGQGRFGSQARAASEILEGDTNYGHKRLARASALLTFQAQGTFRGPMS